MYMYMYMYMYVCIYIYIYIHDFSTKNMNNWLRLTMSHPLSAHFRRPILRFWMPWQMLTSSVVQMIGMDVA